jgi:hypothetical protein
VSLSHDELTVLMAYVDGQLDDEDVAEVEELLAANEDARRTIEHLTAVGEWVRSSADATAKAAKADSIADAVMAEAEKLGGAKVISLDRQRAKRALNRQRIKEFGAIAAVAAAVAAIWAWPDKAHPPGPTPDEIAATEHKGPSYPSPMPRPPENAPAKTGDPSGPGVAPDKGPVIPPESGEALAVGSKEGVDVENVESTHQVSVFYLPVSNKNAASVVVWIGEPAEESH